MILHNTLLHNTFGIWLLVLLVCKQEGILLIFFVLLLSLKLLDSFFDRYKETLETFDTLLGNLI